MQQTLRIATAINAAYLLPLRVMLASLTEHLRASFRPVLYVINRDLNRQQLDSLSALVEVHSIVPGPDATHALPRQHGFLPEVTFPLLLSDILPESLDRVLFLDPDLLILDDLATVWETDLAGRAIAAVRDQAIPFCSSPRGVKNRASLGIPDAAWYFNAGVMLIDIAGWRHLDIPVRASRYIRQLGGETDFLHQEGLNAVLWDNWLPLHQRWNLIASLTGRRYGRYRAMEWVPPGIVHFAGPFKPWRFRIGGPFAASYNELLARHSAGESSQTPSFVERLLSIYDRHVREYLYDCERALWNRRLI